MRRLRHSWVAIAVGAGLGLASIVLYAASGYDRLMLLLWLASLLVLAIAFWTQSTPLPRIARLDVVTPVVLTAAFAPLYLLGLTPGRCRSTRTRSRS